jgi:hypothetical protein
MNDVNYKYSVIVSINRYFKIKLHKGYIKLRG